MPGDIILADLGKLNVGNVARQLDTWCIKQGGRIMNYGSNWTKPAQIDVGVEKRPAKVPGLEHAIRSTTPGP